MESKTSIKADNIHLDNKMIFSTLAFYSSAIIAAPTRPETSASLQGVIVLECLGYVHAVKEGEEPLPPGHHWTVYAYTLYDSYHGAKASADFYGVRNGKTINEFQLNDFGVKYDLAGHPQVGSKGDIVTISQKLVGKGHSRYSSNHLGEMNIMYRDVLPVCNEERMSTMHAVQKGALLQVSLKK